MAGMKANVDAVRARIAAAARRAGRAPEDVELLAAVKYLDVARLGELRDAGVTLVGENRAQQLAVKSAAHPELRWHFIGRLQSRKVKQVLPLVELVHSVATDSVLEQLARHGTPDTEVLVQVNVAAEPEKEGVLPEDLPGFLGRSPVRVVGLMTMPPFAENAEASRPHFARLRALAAEHGLRHLSMGTSQDYEVAVEEGATIVRLGSVLYA
jgi:pyridoxal phosphate enzyme (YggS family)